MNIFVFKDRNNTEAGYIQNLSSQAKIYATGFVNWK